MKAMREQGAAVIGESDPLVPENVVFHIKAQLRRAARDVSA
jgi:hypothetical protein